MIGLLALLCCAILLSGCEQAVQPLVGDSPTSIPAGTSAPVSTLPRARTALPAPGYPYPGPEGISGAPGYPAQETPIFDGQDAYPAADLTATAAAWAQTLTALPAFTPTAPASTQTVTATRGPLAIPLPAPIYFLSLSDGSLLHQIWRLERDGYTLSQITSEETGVDYWLGSCFDVAVDGRLAYVTGNSLVVTDAFGKNRKVIVAGITPPPIRQQDEWYGDKEKIVAPAWSPDGKKIAFRKDGINLIDLSSGTRIEVIAGPNWITNQAGTLVPKEDRFAYHYYPIDWTPDGSRIVLQGISLESFSTAFVKPEMNATVVQVDIFAAGCCDYSFTRDGQMLISSGDHTKIGLWLVDPNTGRARNLTGGRQYKNLQGPIIESPKQAPDGRVFFFTTQTGGYDEEYIRMMLAFVDGTKEFTIPENVTFVSKYPVREGVLWLPDASRVIAGDYKYQLVMIETANGAVTPLGLHGQSLHWGVK